LQRQQVAAIADVVGDATGSLRARPELINPPGMIGDEYADSTPLATGWNAKTDQVPLLGLCRTDLKIARMGVLA